VKSASPFTAASFIAWLTTWFLAFSLVPPLAAQQFKFNLEHLESKAADIVDISLNGNTLQFAAKFLDGKDPEEAQVKKLIAGLEGIYLKTFSFKTEGAWTPADLERVRIQLRAPEWSRIVGIKSSEDGEVAEVYVRNVDKKVNGVAILSCGPKELTVVNIAGPIDLDSLAAMSGHFGLPKLETIPSPKPKKLD
jgi:hypothetical protein